MNTHTHTSYNLYNPTTFLMIFKLPPPSSIIHRHGAAMKPRIPRSINKRRLGDAIGGKAVSPAMGAKTTQQQLRKKMRSWAFWDRIFFSTWMSKWTEVIGSMVWVITYLHMGYIGVITAGSSRCQFFIEVFFLLLLLLLLLWWSLAGRVRCNWLLGSFWKTEKHFPEKFQEIHKGQLFENFCCCFALRWVMYK